MARPHIQDDVWADAGALTDPGDAKTALGYIAEKPPYQTENWHKNRVDEMLAHIEEFGVPEWDVLTDYNINSICLYLGDIYQSKVNSNLGNTPTVDGSNWSKAFVDRLTN